MHSIAMEYKTEENILNLIEGFKSRTLPAAHWTHEAHLITGLWFNYNYSELEAICFLRSGIISYNIGSGGENTSEKGYHETLTLFWCRILNSFVKKNKSLTLVELAINSSRVNGHRKNYHLSTIAGKSYFPFKLGQFGWHRISEICRCSAMKIDEGNSCKGLNQLCCSKFFNTA